MKSADTLGAGSDTAGTPSSASECAAISAASVSMTQRPPMHSTSTRGGSSSTTCCARISAFSAANPVLTRCRCSALAAPLWSALASRSTPMPIWS